jgi:hypothetical protein
MHSATKWTPGKTKQKMMITRHGKSAIHMCHMSQFQAGRQAGKEDSEVDSFIMLLHFFFFFFFFFFFQ